MRTLTQILTEIDLGMMQLGSHRPLSKGEILELRKSLNVAFAHHSTAIEGNSLSLGETKLVLEEGLTIGGKTLREIQEVSNHHRLFDILYEHITEKKDIKLESIDMIHREVMRSIDEENAGKYRSIQNYISGDDLLPPPAKEVKKKMGELMDWYDKNRENIHPVLLAGEFHYRFVKIHPYLDGNGRTIRIIINIILMGRGFPMVIIPNIRRSEYITTLHSNAKQSEFIHFFADIVLVNLEDYLRMIEA